MTLRVAILGSTKGTSWQYVLDKNIKGVEFTCCISNRSKSGILQRAKDHNIEAIFLSKKGKSREEYDDELTQLLKARQVDYVFLIGWMVLLSDNFVKEWKNRVVNIHPSLLPAFAGGMDMKIHKAVLERGCKVTGASIIFIDEGADTGPIIDQAVVRVGENETSETLKQKVQIVEGKLLIDTLELLRDNKISINNNVE